ncbi:MAG: HAD-IA family hydrolase [Spirochaetes bacterium]|nr:HAD-IA family hydrolase [Spirochaetota bacterium]MBU0956065.1 HAD-IA family hydrolase [Spirochaetota bacterium]
MIQAVFFDLDNTLYPASAGMEEDIVRRMTQFAAEFLGVSSEEAMRLRRANIHQYGTTLEWLMKEHGLRDYDHYFSVVHPDGEEAMLEIDPALPGFLENIQQRKYVFTNAPMEHATRILKRFGIEHCFQKIYDVRFNDLTGKPARAAVERVLTDAACPPQNSIFVDDVPRYVRGFSACGGKGILIDHYDKYTHEDLPRIRSIYELDSYLH